MAFPQTRHSLIQRLAAGGEERDWQEFFQDYWRPVCRFALRSAPLTLEDAEDVASETFLVVHRNQLLARWVANRTAKLRTLLCSVVRHILANRARVEQGRQRLRQELAAGSAAVDWLTSQARLEAPAPEVDAFYAAWVDELLQTSAESLLTQYNQDGKGDYFRVLYGHVCEGLTLAEVARTLGMTLSRTQTAYRQARTALARRLKARLHDQLGRYGSEEEIEQEFASEWKQLRAHLQARGGLEEAVRRAYSNLLPPDPSLRDGDGSFVGLGKTP
jgi:RNA polymerase sigma factor (sigma-70 family)